MPALVCCPDCGRHILSEERSCPHCGADTPKIRGRPRTAAAAALGLLALVGCPGGINSDYGTSSTETEPADTGVDTGSAED